MKKTSIVLTACLLVMSACHEPAAEPDKNLAPTMGWSSWNTYGINISEQLIREQADAMASSGLKEAGYEYINIDDGYFGRRDSTDGHLLIRFPYRRGLITFFEFAVYLCGGKVSMLIRKVYYRLHIALACELVYKPGVGVGGQGR